MQRCGAMYLGPIRGAEVECPLFGDGSICKLVCCVEDAAHAQRTAKHLTYTRAHNTLVGNVEETTSSPPFSVSALAAAEPAVAASAADHTAAGYRIESHRHAVRAHPPIGAGGRPL